MVTNVLLAMFVRNILTVLTNVRDLSVFARMDITKKVANVCRIAMSTNVAEMLLARLHVAQIWNVLTNVKDWVETIFAC